VISRPAFRVIKNRKNLTGVEIGVSSGENALNILENLDIALLYLIDPYIEYEHFRQENINRWENLAHSRLDSKYIAKIVWIKNFSAKVINLFNDETLDFVYIDGDHKYDNIKLDLELYYPKVKLDGLFAGHDFTDLNVTKAVDEFFCDHMDVQLYCFKCEDTDTADWWAIK